MNTVTKFIGDIVFNNGEKDINVSDLVTVDEVNEALKSCVKNSNIVDAPVRKQFQIKFNENFRRYTIDIDFTNPPKIIYIEAPDKWKKSWILNLNTESNAIYNSEDYDSTRETLNIYASGTAICENINNDATDPMYYIDETYVISCEMVVIDDSPKDIPSVKYVEKMINEAVPNIIDVPPQPEPISFNFNDEYGTYILNIDFNNPPAKLIIESPEEYKNTYTLTSKNNDFATYNSEDYDTSLLYLSVSKRATRVYIGVGEAMDEMHQIDTSYVIYDPTKPLVDDSPKEIPTVKYVEKLINEAVPNIIDVPPQREPLSFVYNDESKAYTLDIDFNNPPAKLIIESPEEYKNTYTLTSKNNDFATYNSEDYDTSLLYLSVSKRATRVYIGVGEAMDEMHQIDTSYVIYDPTKPLVDDSPKEIPTVKYVEKLIESSAPNVDLSDYATKSELTTTLTDYAKNPKKIEIWNDVNLGINFTSFEVNLGDYVRFVTSAGGTWEGVVDRTAWDPESEAELCDNPIADSNGDTWNVFVDTCTECYGRFTIYDVDVSPGVKISKVEKLTLIDDSYVTKSQLNESAFKTTPANTTITHYCPIEESLNNITDFLIGSPVYLTGKVYKFDKQSKSFVTSTANDTTDCICSVKTNGKWNEYVGICVRIDEVNRCVTFATHGDYLVKVTDTSCYGIGDEVFVDDGELKVLTGMTALTAKIKRTTVGVITAKINDTMLAVFKS